MHTIQHTTSTHARIADAPTPIPSEHLSDSPRTLKMLYAILQFHHSLTTHPSSRPPPTHHPPTFQIPHPSTKYPQAIPLSRSIIAHGHPHNTPTSALNPHSKPTARRVKHPTTHLSHTSPNTSISKSQILPPPSSHQPPSPLEIHIEIFTLSSTISTPPLRTQILPLYFLQTYLPIS